MSLEQGAHNYFTPLSCCIQIVALLPKLGLLEWKNRFLKQELKFSTLKQRVKISKTTK